MKAEDMKKRHFLKSLNEAVEGFLYVVRYERHMSVHFMVGFMVLLLAIFLGVTRLEWIVLSSIISFVLVAEMVNTAIEKTTDLIHSSYHPKVRIIKHIGAGMVLVSVVNALIIGFFIFSGYFAKPFDIFTNRVRYGSALVTFISLLISIFFVIVAKAYLRRGTPFRGGILSGHSAVAFALWTAIVFANPDLYVAALSFFIALLVAQSRLRAKIHSFWEVVAGGVVGTLVTTLFFQLFS